MLRSMVVISKGIMCSICVYSRAFSGRRSRKGAFCVQCGSPLSQFSDWDRLVLSRGELGCRS